MIYLTEGNMPLNEAYNDEIVQERNNTYQLTFRFPTSDLKWELLKEETFLTADDLHGEQDFYIFEVEKQQGYIQVYANQVFSLLNNYVVNPISLDRQTGSTALSRFAGSITRDNPFSFFSDIEDRHTFNIDSKNAMEAFAKDKHSILGQWGGDLVRHGYQVRLLKNGGSENESLFMYKKNLSSYQHKTSTKSLRTRITFKTTIKGEGEKAPDKHYSVTIESSLINKYSQIYEDVVEVNDQDVKDEASLRKYGEQYFRTTLCDMLEDSLEIEVVGQSDVPVQMFDVVSIYHEGFGLDVRKKITKYTYSPMAKKLKSIGFGQFKSGLASAIGNMISDALKNETQGLLGSVDAQIAKELRNADLAFDRKKEELVNQFTDELNATKAKAEEVKRQIADEIDKKFQSFDNAAINEARRKAEEALRSAGASNSLAEEAKRISERAKTQIDNLKSSSQTAIEQIEAFKTQYGTKLNEVKNTADGLFTKMGAIETYISKDGQRQESLQRYARDESARQASAIREQISRDYVGKSTYQEDVRGLERRFSAISTQTNNDIATKITQYKQTVDGQFASITSQIAGKANQTDFQRVKETSQLYERIIGRNENDISNKVARMALTNQLFQVEVAKSIGIDNNLIVRSKSMDRHTLVNEGNTKRVFVNNGIFTIRCTGNSGYTFAGFTLPLYIDRMARGETYTLNFKYRIMGRLDHNFTVAAKNHQANETIFASDVATSSIAVSSNWQEFNETYTISKDFEFGNSDKYPLYFYLARNGWVEIKEIMLVRASQTNGYKASQFDDMSEAVRTVQSQLDGSWAIQNLTSAGSIVSQINATNNQILIEAAKIRLKGKTLLDELTAIQGYFKRLFVGEGNFAKLNAEIIGSNTITADKLIMDQAMARLFVSSNIFTDMLAAKEAFINKLRSVVVTATFLEGFQGKIGGFRFGQYANRNGYFITGINSVSIGMGNGTNAGANRNAFWANWGESLDTPGPKAWYVNTDGKMYCRNDVDFYSKVDFASTSKVNFYSKINAPKGIWIASDDINGEGDNPDGGYNRVVWWSQIVTGKWRQHAGITTGSDRKLKENIEPTQVKALDKINALNLVAFDYIKDKTHEEIGLIAQEVLNIIPGSVEKYEGEDNYLTINYSKFVPYLIKAIQELNEKIERRTA
ncbi:hypothetical protein B7696_00365 [Streptococcus mitis]|uniref:Peptidase S74 domain-containing protein n=1 Tax=Streptococcus mitis TaxID=28037 RepID=A0A1X1KNF8_STRMT|nr:phage tail spike protein [Streptococcus mitis]ORP00955.1 hypothetical protein B7696_00365 [Streptococcus mitis]